MPKLKDKTDFMLTTTIKTKDFHNLSTSSAIVSAQKKKNLYNLSLTLDGHRSMDEHISTIAGTCYFKLCRLTSIHRFLSNISTATLALAFVLSRIDYSYSLLVGST